MNSLLPSLADIGIVDAPTDEFDRITELAAALSRAPIAVVSLIEPDRDQQFVKSARGLPKAWAAQWPTTLGHGYCVQVRKSGAPLVVCDSRGPSEDCPVDAAPGLDFVAYLGVPIRGLNNEPIGALCAIDGRPRSWTYADMVTLERLASFLNEQIQLRGALCVSERYRSELQVLASTDPLTGLANRRTFYEHAEGELMRVVRTGRVASLLLLDLDHFKRVNDTYGHSVGDAVLVEAARRIATCARRKIDLAARLGGEEFAILLPETDAKGALVLAERVRAALSGEPIAIGEANALRITTSVGIAVATPATASIEEFLRSADEAVYRAKHAGRNQVAVAGEGVPQVA
jgi:diguanylate cyclase (GGDEF)-like protein